MTDQSKEKPDSVPRLAPLPRLGKTRDPEVEREASELLRYGESEILRRAAVLRAGQPGYVKEETVVAILRLRMKEDPHDEIAWRLIELLQARFAGYIEKRVFRFIKNPARREECAAEIQSQLLYALLDRSEKEVFWEIVFQLCLTRLCSTLTLKETGRAKHEADLPPFDEEDGETPLERLPDRKVVSMEDRALLNDALSRLTERERKVFVLSEGEKWSQKEIAEKMGVTPRTVYNILASVEKKLEVWRSPGRDGL